MTGAIGLDDDALDLTISRVIAASREAIWHASTDADMLRKWWALEPFEVVDCLIELRPGGSFVTVMTDADGTEHVFRAAFLELVEPERLIFTDALVEGFRPSGVGTFTAAITLDEHDGGTRYTARALHKTADDRRHHEETGFVDRWNAALDRLEMLVKH